MRPSAKINVSQKDFRVKMDLQKFFLDASEK